MFFRAKSVKGISILQLAGSRRNAKSQTRQRVIVSLGGAKMSKGE